MANRVSARRKRKTMQFLVILLNIFLTNMHFITNGFKCFLWTNSSDPRQRVPLSEGVFLVCDYPPKVGLPGIHLSTKNYVFYLTFF